MSEIKVPELAESITEGTVAHWLKKTGEFVQKGDYIVELETDKVNVEIISEETGVLKELKAAEGDIVKVGETIAIVDEKVNPIENRIETPVIEQNIQIEKPQLENVKPETEKVHRKVASPAARKMAREKGIDLNQIPTMDPLGRVRVQDVTSYQNTQETKLSPVPVSQEVALIEENEKPTQRIRMTRRRQTIANRLLEVKQTTAMLTTFNEVDMTNVMNLRKRRKDQFFEENNVKLGYMSFFTKAVVAALKKAPLLNAEIQGDEIVLKKYYDIGIAVSTDDGLIVPVVRDCERKNFAEIESEIMDLANKARSNKLSLKDLQGGTFTITNGGIFGSLLSTPILNGPQVGILGMHSIQLRPVAIDKEKMENRPMMYIALSYDHRIVDGKEAVTFLKRVKELIEDPESLLFEA
ncbi:dihydrolipoyllysine-residue succinyltransferase [Bacillus sp. 03113]|uniref:dihydrolipoyllysine-residue succinyltransferase n=1 Tax=Bacillus sp. 03113 TaxID=2578211 RepID=UPI0011432209|nr:dihydrolipoyllysine-residue succinyltransferase [Bacillus sp. 03113]